eukprot:TRINITY_DN5137_c0_g3_i3.p1 TRINITY_DN5137_c0_g3~~TRINITY_DN5137_c0_g3_i3.p1  ORF type:complete len:377 (+),score=26.79 TRINITY_DN5137_c0_g3_i3:113-1132(+)
MDAAALAAAAAVAAAPAAPALAPAPAPASALPPLPLLPLSATPAATPATAPVLPMAPPPFIPPVLPQPGVSLGATAPLTMEQNYFDLQRNYSDLQRNYSDLQRTYSDWQRNYSDLQQQAIVTLRTETTLDQRVGFSCMLSGSAIVQNHHIVPRHHPQHDELLCLYGIAGEGETLALSPVLHTALHYGTARFNPGEDATSVVFTYDKKTCVIRGVPFDYVALLTRNLAASCGPSSSIRSASGSRRSSSTPSHSGKPATHGHNLRPRGNTPPGPDRERGGGGGGTGDGGAGGAAGAPGVVTLSALGWVPFGGSGCKEWLMTLPHPSTCVAVDLEDEKHRLH